MLEDIRSAIEQNIIVLLITTDYAAASPNINQKEFYGFCRDANSDDESVMILFDYYTPNFFISANRKIYLVTSGIKQGSGPGLFVFIGGANSVEG